MNLNRREILKGLFAIPFLRGVSSQTHPTVPLDPNLPTAKALGYYEDASKVDVAKWPKKAQDKNNQQNCKSCILYVKGGLKAQGRDGEWGVCSLFPQGLVPAMGWCNSWAPRPQ